MCLWFPFCLSERCVEFRTMAEQAWPFSSERLFSSRTSRSTCTWHRDREATPLLRQRDRSTPRVSSADTRTQMLAQRSPLHHVNATSSTVQCHFTSRGAREPSTGFMPLPRALRHFSWHSTSLPIHQQPLRPALVTGMSTIVLRGQNLLLCNMQRLF